VRQNLSGGTRPLSQTESAEIAWRAMDHLGRAVGERGKGVSEG
jgi:hypothetical protein